MNNHQGHLRLKNNTHKGNGTSYATSSNIFVKKHFTREIFFF